MLSVADQSGPWMVKRVFAGRYLAYGFGDVTRAPRTSASSGMTETPTVVPACMASAVWERSTVALPMGTSTDAFRPDLGMMKKSTVIVPVQGPKALTKAVSWTPSPPHALDTL